MSVSPVIEVRESEMQSQRSEERPTPSLPSCGVPSTFQGSKLSASGYMVDATDTAMPSTLTHSPLREVNASKTPSSSLLTPLASNVVRLPSDPLYYAEDAIVNHEASYAWAPRRRGAHQSMDMSAPPFTLSNSTDSASSGGSFNNLKASGDSHLRSPTSPNPTTASTGPMPRTRVNLPHTGNSPDVVYPDFLAGEADFIAATPRPVLTLDDMFADIKKDGLVSFLKILENASSDGKSVVDLSTLLRRHIAKRAAAPPAVKDWNKELQNLLDMDASEEKYLRLRELAHDFNLTAEVYAKILISELFLSPNEKTIPPSTIGGLAGGTKFICQGILFKFAVDVQLPNSPFWMYGKTHAATEYAMKAAGSELRHIVALSNALGDTDLRLPLMALIDYRGFRLVASSILPIGTHTIVYGSDNAGFNVYADPMVSGMFDIVAKRMNLKKHRFGDVELSGPVDIEIHKGEDNRHYIIDVARLFPPEAPDLCLMPHPRSNYFKMLRPCLVFKYESPLSSDAYSGFGRHNEEKHNSEVWAATKCMHEEVIPNLAQVLNAGGSHRVKTSAQLCQMMHKAGINLRYLGLLRSHLKESPTAANTVSSSGTVTLGSSTILTDSTLSMNTGAFALPNYYPLPVVGVGASAQNHGGTPGGSPPLPDSVLMSDTSSISLNSSRASDSMSFNARSPILTPHHRSFIQTEVALKEVPPVPGDSPPVSPRDRSYSLSSTSTRHDAYTQPLSSSEHMDNALNRKYNSTSLVHGFSPSASGHSSGSVHSGSNDKIGGSTNSSVSMEEKDSSYSNSGSQVSSPVLSSKASYYHKKRSTKARSVDRTAEKRNSMLPRTSVSNMPTSKLTTSATGNPTQNPIQKSGNSNVTSSGLQPPLFTTGNFGSVSPQSNSTTSSGELSVGAAGGAAGLQQPSGVSGLVTPIYGSMSQLPAFVPDNPRKSFGSIRQIVLREMIARTLKCKLRQAWRRTMQSHRISIEAPFADVALKMLNTVFYKLGDESETYWRQTMVPDLIAKYSVGLSDEELSGQTSLYHFIDGYQLFKIFIDMVGIRINWTPEQLYHRERRFLYTDIESIDCIVRPMNIVTISEGILLSMMASNEPDHSQRLDLLNMAEKHLESAYSALFNPLATAELGHVRYSRMYAGSVEDRQKDAEASFVCYVEAVLQHRNEMDTDNSISPGKTGGTLGTSKTFLHTTLLRLLELALIHLPGNQHLGRLARCADAQELHMMISRWLGWLYKTNPASTSDGIDHVMELLRRVFTSSMGFPLLLNSLKHAPRKLIDAIREDLLQVTALEIPGQPRIFGHGETSVAHLFEMCRSTNADFWMPQVQRLDMTDIYTLTNKHLQQILPYCPNLLSLKLGGCHRLTSDLAEVIALNRLRPLQYLDISRCYALDDDFFLEAIPLLHSLKLLDMSDCPLVTETSLFVLSRRAVQITSLSMNGCIGITNFQTLEHFIHLETLELQRCPHVSSAQVGNFFKPGIRLNRLNISNNPQLDDSVFANISGPTSLTDLRMAETDVTITTMEILIQFARGLTALDISDCPKLFLDALGDKLGAFNHLRLLHTRGQTNFSAGPLFIGSRMSLTVLDISRSSHSVQSVLIKSTLPALTSLNISRCNEFIASNLVEFGLLQHLTQLNMSGCVNVTDSVISSILDRLKGLVKLELAYCSQLTAAVLPAIGRSCPQLRLLDLESCVGIDHPKLSELGYACQDLAELRLSRICLKNPTIMKSLFRGSLSSLRIIKMKECMLTDESLKEIALHSPSLQELELSDNPEISTAGVKHLFQQCHYLQQVLLAGVHTITDDAFPKSSKRRLRSLKVLDLSGCKNITDTTVLTITKRCPILTSFNISGCKEITKDSCKTLIRTAAFLNELKVRLCDHIPSNSLEIPSSERASKNLQIFY